MESLTSVTCVQIATKASSKQSVSYTPQDKPLREQMCKIPQCWRSALRHPCSCTCKRANNIHCIQQHQRRSLNVLINCYKGFVLPIMEYAATVWDAFHKCCPTVLRGPGASCRMQDFSPTTVASGLFSKLNLQPLSHTRTVAMAMMMAP